MQDNSAYIPCKADLSAAANEDDYYAMDSVEDRWKKKGQSSKAMELRKSAAATETTNVYESFDQTRRESTETRLLPSGFTTKEKRSEKSSFNKCAILAVFVASLALFVSIAALCFGLVLNVTNSNLQEVLNNTAEFSVLYESLSTRILMEVQGTINDTPIPKKTSCKYLSSKSRSGYYHIETSTGVVHAYCDTDQRNCSCNTTGGWMRVANLDMTDPTQQCPEGLNLITRSEPPLRTCGRPNSTEECASVTFSVYGIQYSHVCGRVIGYQIGTPDAFWSYNVHNQTTIDDHYLDGISLTYGRSPRQHIWSFAGAYSKRHLDLFTCPCTHIHGIDHNYTASLPPFIGDDYFCDSAVVRERYASADRFYSDNPLWDGRGCGENSTCCEFNNPPWFCKQLPQPTADDIELRICGNEMITNEDLPIEIMELYIN